jgi:hypothetical protein
MPTGDGYGTDLMRDKKKARMGNAGNSAEAGV